MEFISTAFWILLGVYIHFSGFHKIAYVILGLSALMVIHLILEIVKYGSYKAWKENERILLEALEEAPKTNEDLADTVSDTVTTLEPIKPLEPVETYMQEMYRERQIDSSNFDGLFYPDIAGYDIPCGYHNIPVPSYVAYDLETTGLTPTHDEILEIGAIRIVNGEITGIYHEYVHPSRPISGKITKINGITNDMVKDSSTIDVVLPKFIEFTERLPMVAYNAEFDYSFIKEAWLKISGKNFTRKHFCSMKIFKKYYKEIWLAEPVSAKLTFAVKEILGPKYSEEFEKVNHEALVDASAAQIIFEVIGGIINNK